MATVNHQLLKMFIDVIPNFDGTPSLLNDFIDACDELIDNYGNSESDVQNKFLIRAIKHKLRVQAQVNTSTRLEIGTRPEIKETLTLTFGDPRDLDTLQQDIIHLSYDNKKEILISFSNKILQCQSLVMSKLKRSLDPKLVKEAPATVYQKLS